MNFSYQVGEHVCLHSLEKDPKINGKIGEVKELLFDKHRLTIRLFQEARLVNVKESNLKKAEPSDIEKQLREVYEKLNASHIQRLLRENDVAFDKSDKESLILKAVEGRIFPKPESKKKEKVNLQYDPEEIIQVEDDVVADRQRSRASVPNPQPPVPLTSVSASADTVKRSDTYDFIKKTVLSAEDQEECAQKLIHEGYKTHLSLVTMNEEDLKEAGITKRAHIKAIMDIVRNLSAPKTPSTEHHLMFFSYAKIDTVAETGILFDAACYKFPNRKIFRDAESRFELSALMDHVKNSKNVVVLLSDMYPKRPYTLAELHASLQSGANICPIKVTREGMKPFDFEKVTNDIQSGAIKTYLNEEGWMVLNNLNISLEDVCKDLKNVMNVRAFDYSSSYAKGVRDAMIEEIFSKGIILN